MMRGIRDGGTSFLKIGAASLCIKRQVKWNGGIGSGMIKSTLVVEAPFVR